MKAPTPAALPAADVAPAQENVTETAAEGTTDATPTAAVTPDADMSTGAAVAPATELVPELLGGLPGTGLL